MAAAEFFGGDSGNDIKARTLQYSALLRGGNRALAGRNQRLTVETPGDGNSFAIHACFKSDTWVVHGVNQAFTEEAIRVRREMGIHRPT